MAEVLYICSANKDRSPCAEQYFSTLEGTNKHMFDSAGTNPEWVCRAIKKRENEWQNRFHVPKIVSYQLLKKNDIIYVMEPQHVYFIHMRLKKNRPHSIDTILNKIFVLGIKDQFSRDEIQKQNDLKSILHDKLFTILSLNTPKEINDASLNTFFQYDRRKTTA